MSTPCDPVLDDLAMLIDGDDAAVARHADHLASCDACRDARHDAEGVAARLALAGADYIEPADRVARLLAAIDREAPPAPPAGIVVAESPRAREPARRRSPALVWAAFGATAAAGVLATLAVTHVHDRGAVTVPHTDERSAVAEAGSIGTLSRLDRAAADKGDGVMVRAGDGWRAVHVGDALPTGAELRTDDRTRAQVTLADGTTIALDHRTELAFDAHEPRAMRMTAGHLVADVVHVEHRPAEIATPSGKIEVVGTKLAVTATDALTSVQVSRGTVTLATTTQHDSVHAGEEGVIDHGQLAVSAAPQLAHDLEWADLEQTKPNDPSATSSGLGSLRAYKPGESRDRDWNLALAKHDVKVRIIGPIARTEITETFRNDAAATLEGVYQFPLPADAQIDALALDSKDAPDGFIDGAFVDKQRGARIWQGVIQHATPHQQIATNDIIWVPGKWRDPALLEWQRGGRFELKVYPIPANGERTIKLAYTQVVAPHGPGRQYVYPLPHSHDGSTVADQMSVDVEVRGAPAGGVRAIGYDLAADPARAAVNGMTLAQTAFVPRGDLVIDYRSGDDAELRAWTAPGGAAVAPDDALAARHGASGAAVGLDPKVIATQHEIAADLRPTAVLALRPQLPRWRADKPRDIMIVVDDSQSMVGERFTRAGELATALIAQMDRRDQFSVMVCDSECRSHGDLRAPTAGAASELGHWLAAQQPAGASDVVASVRGAVGALPAGDRDRWVLYISDGAPTTGFRRAADIERALGETTKGAHVTAIAVGGDADAAALQAVARGGGGSYLAWLPGQKLTTTATAALETTYGNALRDAVVELPAGLTDVAPSVLPTVRAGEEVLLAARVTGDVDGDVVVHGSVAGQPFAQHYHLKLAAAAAPGNGFVPRLWASLAIAQLEQRGTNEDRARIVALSQGYGVMSRETSLLVLESQAMFDAFGVDRHRSAATWTGEGELDEVAAVGDRAQDDDKAAIATGGAGAAAAGPMKAPANKKDSDRVDKEKAGADSDSAKAEPTTTPVAAQAKAEPPPPPPAPRPVTTIPAIAHVDAPPPAHSSRGTRTNGLLIEPDDDGYGGGHAGMVAMRKVWERVPSVTAYGGVASSITAAVDEYDATLTAKPDSREAHRALVQALSYAGDLDRARDIAKRWLERDPLDPEALGYQADLLGRDGQRDLALRTLAGLVDLDPDRVALHQRMVTAYERVGRLGQACGHRITLAALAPGDVAAAGGAVRCLRTLGRDHDAELVLSNFGDEHQRTAVEKAATVAPLIVPVAGDLVLRAHWDNGADLDLSIVTPDGTRLSWMGGRADLAAADATSTEHEQLALKSLKRGNYLVEIGRGALPMTGPTGPVHGTLEVAVLGTHTTLPFELTGSHVVVGRVGVALVPHLEEVDSGQRWRMTAPNVLVPD